MKLDPSLKKRIENVIVNHMVYQTIICISLNERTDVVQRNYKYCVTRMKQLYRNFNN